MVSIISFFFNLDIYSIYSSILQQILVSLCVRVSDSECVSHQPSLTSLIQHILLTPQTLILSEMTKITDSGAQRDRTDKDTRQAVMAVVYVC